MLSKLLLSDQMNWLSNLSNRFRNTLVARISSIGRVAEHLRLNQIAISPNSFLEVAIQISGKITP